MADADSLHDIESSDLDADPSAVEADAESEEQTEESPDASSRKKSKKKRRKLRDIERSSGDSDNQASNDEMARKCLILTNEKMNSDQSQSGVDADSESQGSRDFRKVVGDGDVEADEGQAGASLNNLAQLKKAVELLTLKEATVAPKNFEEARQRKFHFWETQPVPKFDEVIEGNEEIEPDKPVGEIRAEPLSLPAGFCWDTLDIGDPLILKELYTLLNENYVEDDDNMFRFDYSPEFLQWALQPPGWLRVWHCGVRVVKSKKLVGFISAVPAKVKIYNRMKRMVEINFLCVHKKLRSKRVAPVLIKEITRRVHQQGLFQAVYTAGVVLPKPVSSCRYWHRSLNPRKLIEVKFSHLSRNMTMQRTLKLYKLPDFLQQNIQIFHIVDGALVVQGENWKFVDSADSCFQTPRTPGFRKFTPADVPDAYNLLIRYMQQFDLAPVFSEEDFRHWFIPRENIVDSFVVERDGDITDFVSFYTLPSTVMHHPTHKLLRAAYSFYNVSGATPWVDLMQDALVVAKNMGFDVFNALDLMENKQFLEKLKFGVGDGFLQYYLYNWKCPTMDAKKVGLVLQ